MRSTFNATAVLVILLDAYYFLTGYADLPRVGLDVVAPINLVAGLVFAVIAVLWLLARIAGAFFMVMDWRQAWQCQQAELERPYSGSY